MNNEFENLYAALMTEIEQLKIEHEKHMLGNKSAGARARKSIGEIKKLCTPYRKLSNDLDKHRKTAKETNNE